MKNHNFIPLTWLIIISLLGCSIEIDISIPSFPSIMSHFEASEVLVQQTLSLNFLSFCLSGLLYGPLSEAWGRRRLMLFGALTFLIGALGCVFSFSIYQLLFWRFIQGLGASSTLVLGFAMISDRYQGDLATKNIGKINAYITLFMAAAPIIGSLLINAFTWQANFAFVSMIALVAFVLLALYLPETKTQMQPFKIKGILNDYWHIVIHKKFMLYALMPNMIEVAYLTFVGNASFFYMNTKGLTALQFACHQGLLVILFSLTSFYANHVINKIGANRSVTLGMQLTIIGVVLMTYFVYFKPEPWLITFCMSLFAIGCAFPLSVIFAKSLEVIPSHKGVCSSFIMSSRLLLSSAAISLTGIYFDGTMRPVSLVITGCTFIALIAYGFIERSEEPEKKDKTKTQLATSVQ